MRGTGKVRGTAGTGGTGSSCRVGGDAGRFSSDFEMLKNALLSIMDWFTVAWKMKCIFSRGCMRSRNAVSFAMV